MQRRRPRQSSSQSNGRKPDSRSRSVVLIDSSKIRAKAKRAFESARRRVEKARLDIEYFHSKDEPAFQQWLLSRFGPLVTELRDLASQFASLEEIVSRVEAIRFAEGVSYAEAYKLATEEPSPELPGKHDERQEPRNAHDPFDPDDPSDEPGGFADDFARLVAGAFGLDLEPEPDPDLTRRTKEVFRKLARLLHPDANAQVSDQMRAWWHESQQAYEQGDLPRLEAILTAVQGKGEGTSAPQTISSLQKLTAQMRRTYYALSRELRECQGSPAWQCATRPPTPRTESSFRTTMLGEREDLRRAIHQFQKQIEVWKSESERPARAAKPRRRPRGRRSGAGPNDQTSFEFDPF